MMASARRLRIAQVAPPLERVPPLAYGGTERIVHELSTELVRRGHELTVFASGDSEVPGRLVPTVPRALRPADSPDDVGYWFGATVDEVLKRIDEFDIIHSHLEWWSIPFARMARVPVAATFHGRLDLPFSRRMFERPPDGLVAVSRHQASTHPEVPWTVIHNGLTLDTMPFGERRTDAFCFVGRVDPEKGILEAIEVALQAGRPLKIAAKIGYLPAQRDYDENVFRPALKRAGSSVEYLGELEPRERDQLFAESYATLMPGSWPEPFGLVAIESLATGTPIIARRIGALPEIIREGVDGVFGDDVMAMAFLSDRVGSFDRAAIRARVIERFSAERMTDRYEELYARLAGGTSSGVERLRAELAASDARDTGGTTVRRLSPMAVPSRGPAPGGGLPRRISASPPSVSVLARPPIARSPRDRIERREEPMRRGTPEDSGNGTGHGSGASGESLSSTSLLERGDDERDGRPD